MKIYNASSVSTDKSQFSIFAYDLNMLRQYGKSPFEKVDCLELLLLINACVNDLVHRYMQAFWTLIRLPLEE